MIIIIFMEIYYTMHAFMLQKLIFPQKYVIYPLIKQKITKGGIHRWSTIHLIKQNVFSYAKPTLFLIK